MTYHVYYLNNMRDSYNVKEFSPKTHRKVVSIKAKGLEDVFRQMNVVDGWEKPTELNVRSMSVGDVVVHNGNIWLCDLSGWRQL